MRRIVAAAGALALASFASTAFAADYEKAVADSVALLRQGWRSSRA